MLLPRGPILLQELDVVRRKPRSDVNFAIRNSTIDLKFGNGPAIHKNEKRTATPLDAQRIERQPAVLVQFEQGAMGPIGRAVKTQPGQIVFRKRWHFLD